MSDAKQWRYLRSGYGSRSADFDIVNESGGRVASTPYEDKARLIAAAPELLEALKELVSRHTESEGLTMSVVANKNEFERLLNECDARVDAAIDKAIAAIDKAGQMIRRDSSPTLSEGNLEQKYTPRTDADLVRKLETENADLREVLGLIEMETRINGQWGCADVNEFARAAIAKAEGK